MPHSLPSGDSITTFTAHFKSANYRRSGCDITFTLPVEMKEAVFKLSDNDGLALNVEVWATVLDGESEGLGEDLANLARVLGLDT